MTTHTIAITTSSFGTSDLLRKKFNSIALNPHGRKLTGPELIALAKNCEGIIAGLETYDEKILNQLPNLKVISRVGGGLDAIDLELCKKRNIQVFITADAVVEPVAELTVGLILNLLRQIELQSVDLKAGEWKRRSGTLLEGKTVGIVGYGRIGKRVAELLKPFRCKIIAADVQTFTGVEQKHFGQLIQEADVLTLHCNVSSGLKPLIDRNVLSKMKKGALLINTARGSLVDEPALCDALTTGHLSGAALDVFSDEPYQGKLQKIPNIILTPHIGSFAAECRAVMESEAINNLIKGLGCA